MNNLEYFKQLHEAEESGATADEEISDEDTDEDSDKETSDEETDAETTDDDEVKDEEDEDSDNESEFIDMFLDTKFVKAFKGTIKQYVSEKLLEDEFNNFTVLPFVEVYYKDGEYGINVEFESAVSMNVDDSGKVVERDIPDVKSVKYKTPAMDNLTVLETPNGMDVIGVMVKEALEEIKTVPR